ncbi:MAG: DeoR family transcriptional regulator [Candidatus Niyogibacteria bacterium]|nr:DeoR family transcriptional regulator [Candidatus Niyogibacteria bacterium]
MACDLNADGNLKSHCEYIQVKVGKITEALYRVTDLFPDEEPLKWLLREQGVKIFNNLQALDRSDLHSRVKNIDAASQIISRMLGSLELSSAGTFISGLNFEVLRREYSALHDFIDGKKESLLPQPIGFFADLGKPAPIFFGELTPSPSDITTLSSRTTENAEIIKGHISDNGQKSVKNSNGPQGGLMDMRNLARKKEIIIDAPRKYENIGGVNGNNESDIKLDRQQKIFEFIRHNGWVGVGEVAKIFTDGISEKTIQRDLMFMADSGILRKAGDKRWRRYAAI